MKSSHRRFLPPHLSENCCFSPIETFKRIFKLFFLFMQPPCSSAGLNAPSRMSGLRGGKKKEKRTHPPATSFRNMSSFFAQELFLFFLSPKLAPIRASCFWRKKKNCHLPCRSLAAKSGPVSLETTGGHSHNQSSPPNLRQKVEKRKKIKKNLLLRNA